ncbi:MAG: TetR family transcriptional regulator [Kineosporiaceae bacterium]
MVAEDSGPPDPASTRDRIIATALRLFEERGYERTTMRAVATEAGVSLGSTYYYFASKEHLIQGFYERIQHLHHDASQEALRSGRDPVDRIAGVALAWLDVAEPYHQFAGAFFRVAADPSSPLSPFSEASAPARDAAVDLYREALAGSRLRLGAEFAEHLPRLLWLAHMGLVLFWVHDASPGQRRSRLLVRRAVPLVVRLAAASRLAPLRPLVREVAELLDVVGLPGDPTGTRPGDR